MIRDLRYGLRTLLKQPSYAVVCVLIVALAIGANTVIFSFANIFLLRPLPIERSDEMAWIWFVNPQRGVDRGTLSIADYLDLVKTQTTCESFAAFRGGSHILTGRGDARRLTAMQVSANLLNVWRVQPILGRGFSEEDDRPGAARVVLLSHRYWAANFNADPSIVGARLTLDGEPATVIGVLTPEIEIGNITTIDVWTPLVLDAAVPRDQRSLRVSGRRKPGVSLAAVDAEVAAIARSLETDHPRTNAGWTARAVPTKVAITGTNTWTLLALLGVTVGIILVIACANLANLMLVRASSRTKEIAVRAALGAGRWRIVRQLLSESVVIAAAGGTIGVAIALAALSGMRRASSDPVYQWVSIDVRVLTFAALLSLVTALLFSAAPAFRSSRVDVNDALRGAGRGTDDARSGRGRAVLVVSQLSLALALMIVAGLSVRTMIAIAHAPLGFETRELLTVKVELPDWKYRSESDRRRYWDDALPRLRILPGVSVAAAAARLPVVDGTASKTVEIEGRPAPREQDRPWASTTAITESYFTAAGIPIVAGRDFTAADADGAQAVAIVNDEMAKRYWQAPQNALGARVRLSADPSGRPLTVVGVAGSVKRADLRGSDPEVFVPMPQQPERSGVFLIRGASALNLVSSVRETLRAADLDVAADPPRTFDQILEEELSSTRVLIGMFVAFGVLALAMAAAGLYGVMSYLVSRRVKEFGIRIALGAAPSQIRALMGGQSARLVTIGVVLGLLLGAGLSRLTTSLLYEVSPLDPMTFIGGTVVLIAVAVFATVWPVRRATHVDPIAALRTD